MSAEIAVVELGYLVAVECPGCCQLMAAVVVVALVVAAAAGSSADLLVDR